MRKHHKRWIALAGATTVSLAGFGLFGGASAAADGETELPWPVIQQRASTYAIDGFEIGYLPAELERYGISAKSATGKEGRRSSHIAWVQGPDATYGKVTVLRSSDLTSLDVLRDKHYEHIGDASLEKVEADGREAYISESTGDFFFLAEEGVAIGTYLQPEKWDAEELTKFASSVQRQRAAVSEAANEPEQSTPEEGAEDPAAETAEDEAPEDEAQDEAQDEASDEGSAGEPTDEAPDDSAPEEGAPEEGAPEGAPDDDAAPDEAEAEAPDSEAPEEEPAEEPAEEPSAEAPEEDATEQAPAEAPEDAADSEGAADDTSESTGSESGEGTGPEAEEGTDTSGEAAEEDTAAEGPTDEDTADEGATEDGASGAAAEEENGESAEDDAVDGNADGADGNAEDQAAEAGQAADGADGAEAATDGETVGIRLPQGATAVDVRTCLAEEVTGDDLDKGLQETARDAEKFTEFWGETGLVDRRTAVDACIERLKADEWWYEDRGEDEAARYSGVWREAPWTLPAHRMGD